MKTINGIFGLDGAIGCPFDNSEMKLVEEWRGFKVGMQVAFDMYPNNGVRGEIVAIGEKAKFLDGEYFVAFAVKVDDVIYFATHKQIYHIV